MAAAELAAAAQSVKRFTQSAYIRGSNLANQLTVHDNMVSLPEARLVLERRLGMLVVSSQSLHSDQLCAIDVNAIPQLLSSERIVGKGEIISPIVERGRVVVGFREDHDIVRLALSKEDVIGSLTAQAH